MKTDLSALGNRTLLGTLNVSNSWSMSNVFVSDQQFTYYELIISGMTPKTSKDQGFSAQFISNGQELSQAEYQYSSYGNDTGGNNPQSGSSQTKLVLWATDRSGPSSQAPGINGKMTLFLDDNGSATHTTMLFAANAVHDLGCQVWVAGSYDANVTIEGIVFQFAGGILSGKVDVWGCQ